MSDRSRPCTAPFRSVSHCLKNISHVREPSRWDGASYLPRISLAPKSANEGIDMKTRFKMASLAALTAATLALPAAAQELKDGAKCAPKAGMSKCAAKKSAGKCAPKN